MVAMATPTKGSQADQGRDAAGGGGQDSQRRWRPSRGPPASRLWEGVRVERSQPRGRLGRSRHPGLEVLERLGILPVE